MLCIVDGRLPKAEAKRSRLLMGRVCVSILATSFKATFNACTSGVSGVGFLTATASIISTSCCSRLAVLPLPLANAAAFPRSLDGTVVVMYAPGVFLMAAESGPSSVYLVSGPMLAAALPSRLLACFGRSSSRSTAAAHQGPSSCSVHNAKNLSD